MSIIKNLTWPSWRLFVICTGLIVPFFVADAAQLYRYKDEGGKVVMGRTVPPQLVGQGYEVLNEKGRVIERIAPALTAEQIKQRDLRLAEQRRQEEARMRQAELDASLKQLYSHPNDAVRILKRRVQDIKSVISAAEGKIKFSQKQILELEAKGAELQRKGLPVRDSMLARIANLKQDIENAEVGIEERKKDNQAVLKEFDGKIKRLEVILNKAATDYAPFLQSLELGTEAVSDTNAN